jgi:tetratricopeptide (TPR) repeat protein
MQTTQEKPDIRPFRTPRQPPAHFYGREAYVHLMVDTIHGRVTAGRSVHFIIRGYGGIGKTSVALAVCHHPTTRMIFGELRFFVECETRTTPFLLLQELAFHFHVDLSEGDPAVVLLQSVEALSSTRHLLLILDNAESFLDSLTNDHAKQIDRILSDISALPRVSLILTKRGLEQPLSVKWDPLPELNAPSLEAARMIFTSITNIDIADEKQMTQLNKLVTALDCVPLAVTLLAQVAQSGHESLEAIQERWSESKTDFLKITRSHPDHRETSVSVSIEISIQSPLLRDKPAAKRLLSVVSYLPDGILILHMRKLSSIWGADIQDAASILKQLSLAHTSSNNHFLTTLSTIREHVNRHRRVIPGDLELVREWHLQLANQGGCRPGDQDFRLSIEGITVSQGNISSILRQFVNENRFERLVLEAIAGFSQYLYYSCPNEELLLSILEADCVIDPELKGRLLYLLGHIQHVGGRDFDAGDTFKRAVRVFQTIGHQVGVAWCMQSLGFILRIQNELEDADVQVEKALAEFGSIGDQTGIPTCLWTHGEILKAREEYGKARYAFESALSGFRSIGKQDAAAWCLWSLGDMLLTEKNYSEAHASLREALSEFKSIGYWRAAAVCLCSLGEVFRMQNDHNQAKLAFEEGKTIFESMGHEPGVRSCAESLEIIREEHARTLSGSVSKKVRKNLEVEGTLHSSRIGKVREFRVYQCFHGTIPATSHVGPHVHGSLGPDPRSP